MSEARAELRQFSYEKCARNLGRGEVKRCSVEGRLTGYTIGCPGCGVAASYLDAEVGFIEGAKPAPRRSPSLLGFTRPPACGACSRPLRIEGGALVAGPKPG